MRLRKIMITILIFSCFFVSVKGAMYHNSNKLCADIRDFTIDSEFSRDLLENFSICTKIKTALNVDDYYFVTLYLNIENPRETIYNRWKIFVKNKDKDFKVWIDKSTPESYSHWIEPYSILEGYTNNLIVYKDNSSIEEIELFVQESLEVYVVGRPVGKTGDG